MGMNAIEKSDQELTQDDPWDIETEEEDEIEDDGLLTMLVRKSYLKHLERCLKRNYEEAQDKTPIPPPEFTETITFQAQHLEKKALRASVRVGIYQRHMIRAIEEIKQATKKRTVHPTFFRRKLKRKFKVDEAVQTEDDQKFEKKTDVQNMLSSAFGFSPSYGDHDGIESYEDLLNILTASPKLSETLARPEETNMSDNCNISREVCREAGSPKRLNLDERLQQLGLWTDDTPEKMAPVGDETTSMTLDSLEDPLLHISSKSVLPSNWSHEVALQTRLVHSILQRKSPFKRALIERRFKDLFGVDVDIVVQDAPFPEVAGVGVDSLEARRNLAGFVVKALTPYYIQGRIGSRIVFKTLAKRITDRLLEKSLTPNPKDAKKDVKVCFALKPEILSTKDVDKVFSLLM